MFVCLDQVYWYDCLLDYVMFKDNTSKIRNLLFLVSLCSAIIVGLCYIIYNFTLYWYGEGMAIYESLWHSVCPKMCQEF